MDGHCILPGAAPSPCLFRYQWHSTQDSAQVLSPLRGNRDENTVRNGLAGTGGAGPKNESGAFPSAAIIGPEQGTDTFKDSLEHLAKMTSTCPAIASVSCCSLLNFFVQRKDICRLFLVLPQFFHKPRSSKSLARLGFHRYSLVSMFSAATHKRPERAPCKRLTKFSEQLEYATPPPR